MEYYPNPSGTVGGRGAKSKPAKYVGPKPTNKRAEKKVIVSGKPARKRFTLPKTPSRRLTNEDANMRMSQPRPSAKRAKPQKPKLKHPSWAGSTTKPYAPQPIKKRKIR